MPLQLPNLDDRRYADLVDEARRLIPTYDPTWTNHNPSDPGITVLELFAYVTESLLYRLNRVTDASQAKFLKLLNGPEWAVLKLIQGHDWQPSGNLAADTRATIQALRAPYRAVTSGDYVRLTLLEFNAWLEVMKRAEDAGAVPERWWVLTGAQRDDPDQRPSRAPAIARAVCVPERNLEWGTAPERAEPAPGHVSVAIIPQIDPKAPLDRAVLRPPELLRDALFGFLDERRILTTRVHVAGATYVPIRAELVVAHTADASLDDLPGKPGLVRSIIGKIEQFLHPLTGGGRGEGWPFGRDAFVSEAYEQLEAVPGVDFVTDIVLTSGSGAEARARELWHTEGDLIGIGLEQHELPFAELDPVSIVVAPSTSFVSADFHVTVSAPGIDPALVKRAVKAAVRRVLHPRTRQVTPIPAPGLPPYVSEIRLSALAGAIRAALEALDPASQFLPSVEVDADPQRLRHEGNRVVALAVDMAGVFEIINWRVAVTVAGE